MASSWESFIAGSTSTAAPAHTSVSTAPTPVASAAGGPTVPPAMPVAPPVPQMTYSAESTPHHGPQAPYHMQPHTASQVQHHGMRVIIPQPGSSTSSGPSIPSPQTPVGAGPPPPQGGTQVHETDLPQDMLAAGWRKFWSKREQRIYFWNRATGESLWDMPPGQAGQGAQPPGQQQQYDPISDPLGIQNPSNGSNANANPSATPTTNSSNPSTTNVTTPLTPPQRCRS